LGKLMNNLLRNSVFASCLVANFLLCASEASIINTVDHKNLQLNLYLDLIKYNTQEKMGILPYILANPEGVYLEVGTGGDPIAALLAKIPDTISPTIIASDVDDAILKLLPVRHTQLNKYLAPYKTTGPRLKLQQLDATSMHCFADDYLSGINASAVVHEIVSYAGGVHALDTFFAEAFRVLKADGVLIYRDPEAVTNKDELVNAYFKTSAMRLFSHIFLVKFLDDACGKLALSGRKYKKYDTSNIVFTFYKKNETVPCVLTYQEYFQLRSYEIDFSRPYTICLPRGLCREIERHYLTYLHQCNPLVFVKCLPTIDSNSYFVNYLAHSTCAILEDFLYKNGTSLSNGTIGMNARRIMEHKISNNMQTIEYGILLHFSSHHKERQLYALLKRFGFEPSLYIVQIKADECLLDYRIFGLLYDHINEQIFDAYTGPINKDDILHAQWLKREGEETYVYYSDDELITKVAKISLAHHAVLRPDEQERFVLCPISAAHNTFIPRLCYDEVLKSSLEIQDALGYPVEIKEGKRIIHFSKMPFKKAITIYEDIIKEHPQNYVCLQKFIDHEVVKA
jgi:hypothetical protein